MSTDKIRDEFEEWAATSPDAFWFFRTGDPADLKKARSGELYDFGGGIGAESQAVFNLQWKSWRASRARMAVKLPSFEGYADYIVRELQASFTQAIEAAGLRVEP